MLQKKVHGLLDKDEKMETFDEWANKWDRRAFYVTFALFWAFIVVYSIICAVI